MNLQSHVRGSAILTGRSQGQGHLMIGYASISPRDPSSRLLVEGPYTLLLLPLLPLHGDIRGATPHLPADSGLNLKPRSPEVNP